MRALRGISWCRRMYNVLGELLDKLCRYKRVQQYVYATTEILSHIVQICCSNLLSTNKNKRRCW